MITIRLPRGEWTFHDESRLGPEGGFGEVFRGKGPNGDVAVKRLKISPDVVVAAHREMDIGARLSSKPFNHVMPVLDYGQDAESGRYFLVMPVATGSLQDHLDRSGPLATAEAQGIALQIAQGLLEVDGLVHRDLKPGNVLFYEGAWRIADFGIAKFVEDVTSLNTLRDVLTPAYAAPEQWKGQRPSPATDVYALGCILYRMMNGQPPFVGSVEDVCAGHISGEVPSLSGVDFRLANFTRMMLRKTPDGRPSIARCIEVIGSAASPKAAPSHSALAAAASKLSAERAAADAAKAEADERQARQKALTDDAFSELNGIADRLCSSITAVSDEASREGTRIGGYRASQGVRLGSATLQLNSEDPLPELVRLSPSPRAGFTLIAAMAKIMLSQRVGQQRNLIREWSANLIFAEREANQGFRWYEIGFFRAFGNSEMSSVAVALNDFVLAVGPVMHSYSPAYGPFPIDGENEEEFIHRWHALLARASVQQLYSPGSMPVGSHFFTSGLVNV